MTRHTAPVTFPNSNRAHSAAHLAADWNHSDPWSANPALRADTTAAPLSDMIDRASAQLVILRRTLEDAAQTNTAIRRQSQDLTQRMQQGERFAGELDRRLARAGTAAAVLDKAAAALRGLESLIHQVRAAREGFEKNTAARLDDQRRQFDSQITALQSEFDQRLRAQRDTFDRALREHEERTQARLVALRQEAESCHRGSAALSGTSVPPTLNQADQISDRHAAAAQARAALTLDQAEERLRTLETQAQTLPGKVNAELQSLCDQARIVLGYDPRVAPEDRHGSPATGSLAEVTARSEIALRDTNDSLLRLAAMTRQADQTRLQLEDVEARAGIVAQDHSTQDEQLRATLNDGVQAAHELKAILVESVSATHATLAESSAATQRLATLRDDIESLTASARYNISQSQQADSSLTGTIEAARAKVEVLERSMEQAMHQAAALVAVAKDVAGLTARASAPLPALEQARTAEDNSKKKPRLKKAA